MIAADGNEQEPSETSDSPEPPPSRMRKKPSPRS